MYRRLLLSLLFTCFSFPAFAESDQNLVYSRGDKAVMHIEAGKLRELLERLAELAELGASGKFTPPQLQALASEFAAILQFVDQEASSAVQLLSPLSNTFRSAEFSIAGLGLTGAAIDTTATPAGQLANRLLLDRVNIGITNLILKAAGGWEPVIVNGSANSGNCAGGYSARDAEYVRTGFGRASRYLLDVLEEMETLLSQDVYSRSARDVINFELQFMKGEIELLGEGTRSGRIRPRTERFFQTVVDPIYLGVNDLVLNAPTVEEARMQAEQIKTQLLAAYEILRQCA